MAHLIVAIDPGVNGGIVWSADGDPVECGDIVSAKAAINSTRMTKLLRHYHEALSEDGAEAISLDVFVAAGGWVGITYSYQMSDGFVISGSQTPRPVR